MMMMNNPSSGPVQGLSSSPLQGWGEAFEQDFYHGAKALKSSYTVSHASKSLNNENQDGLMGTRLQSGYDLLEAFGDVILPNYEFDDVVLPCGDDFGPDDLFPDIETYDPLPKGLSPSPIHFSPLPSPPADPYPPSSSILDPFPSSPVGTPFSPSLSDPFQRSRDSDSRPSEGHTPRQVIIKLKKVKCSKKSLQSRSLVASSTRLCDVIDLHGGLQDLGDVIDVQQIPETFSDLNEVERRPEVFDKIRGSSEEDFMEVQMEDEFEFMPFGVEAHSPSFTLKEAIGMEGADVILEDFLRADVSSVTSLVTPPSSPESSTNSSSSAVFSDLESLLSNPLPEAAPMGRRTKGRQQKKQRLSQESRYLRKKEQNKQAALRYRVKKKKEEDDLLSRLKEEQKRQEDLKEKRRDLRQEIGFMKKLLRETYMANGLLPADAFD